MLATQFLPTGNKYSAGEGFFAALVQPHSKFANSDVQFSCAGLFGAIFLYRLYHKIEQLC